LRFPGFEDEWERKKLGEVATNKSKKYNPKNKQTFIKCIELEHLASESGQLLGFTDGSQSGSIKNVFQKNEVLFGKLRPYLKKYLQPNFDGVCSSEIWVLNGNEISNNFLYYLIQTNKFIDLANQSSGSKMPRADWNIVENGIFSIPSCNEQKKLSAFLSLLDERIQTQSKIIEQLITLIQEYRNQIFKQKIRFKGFNSDWEEKTLNEIATFYSGGTPLTSRREFFDGDIPFIRSGEINSDKTEQFISESGLKNSSAKMVEVGDILYALYGATSGQVGLSKIKGAINQAVLCIKSSENHYFIYSYLFHKKETIINTYLQGGQGNLSAEIVKQVKVPVPPLIEQEKVASFLFKVDQKIQTEKTILEYYKNQKKYLLQQMFI
jgi:type I restriction enzyme S subunit